ncbi:hypothetical protein BD309DRAFT_1049535 [Dichomitus squalens]|nr:hypothetical protein BD309DRAFT_1049535 [Dichomitus squalens]
MCHFHEKAVSFLCNVVALRPNSRDPIHRTNPRARRLRKSGKATAPGLGVRVYKEEVRLAYGPEAHRRTPPRTKASLYDVASMSAFHSGEGSRHKRTVTGQLIIAEKKSYEDEDRDLEDLGEVCCHAKARSMINEGVKPSKLSQYHPISQPLGLIESLALVDMPEAVQGYPCRGDLMPSYSPRLLSAGPPSIQVTLASLWTPHSPIFRRHSPITVTKYLQATSPQLASSMMRSGASSGRVASTCPLPSVRSCDRQVEDDIVCWACERRWLACKMWYQANDEGLMEPFMRRAESNADLRAVLEFLSVPREDERAGRIGLGSDLPSADTIKKRPPFRVVDQVFSHIWFKVMPAPA